MIYHPLNRRYFIILQITQDDSLHQRKLNILHLEEKICRCTFLKELLQNYKKNKKFTRGMSLKFNASLCNNEKTNKLCRNVLRNASFKLRDIQEFNLISHLVANKIKKLSNEIKKRHQR